MRVVVGGGWQIWSYCHSDDVGVAYAAALGRTPCIGKRTSLLLKVWPENTAPLASETRWNRVYSTDKIRRNIADFRPTITLDVPKRRSPWDEHEPRRSEAEL